MIQANTAA